MTALCREFGISRKTGHKLFARYKDHGLEALADRPRSPRRVANRLPMPVEAGIVALKKNKPHWGARTPRELLARRSRRRPPRTTSGAWTSRASSASATAGCAIRSPSPTRPRATCSWSRRWRGRANPLSSWRFAGCSRSAACRSPSAPTTAAPSRAVVSTACRASRSGRHPCDRYKLCHLVSGPDNAHVNRYEEAVNAARTINRFQRLDPRLARETTGLRARQGDPTVTGAPVKPVAISASIRRWTFSASSPVTCGSRPSRTAATKSAITER